MSEITERDLFSLEFHARQEAERIRGEWPETMLSDPSVHADVKSFVRGRRSLADDLDQIGNLLAGLQGAGWGRLGPEVRAGYVRLRSEYEAAKAKPVDVEDAA